MISFLLNLIVKTVIFAISVFLVASIFPKIHVKNFFAAITVAIVYGIFNFIAYYIFGLFTWPFGFLTLGIGFWITNTILLILTDKVVDSFRVDSLFWAAMASLVISILNSVLSKLLFTLGIFGWRFNHFL